MAAPIITLTTDYGLSDHLVGTLKGVILKINPEAAIVDICHNVVPFDVLDGALAIAAAYKYFPPRTIHVVVVDPGVGTERRPLVVSGENQYFIAPDNGVLSLVYESEPTLTVRHINAEHYFLQPLSNTFHGRDIFAPVAAWLSKAWNTESLGEVITDFKRFGLPKPKQEGGAWKGLILRVDAFGNLMTNFRAEDVAQAGTNGKVRITVNGKAVSKFHEAYAQGAPGEPFAVVGASGYVEISVNKGSAARTLGVNRGAEVVLEKS